LACASKHRSRYGIRNPSRAIPVAQTVSLASLSMPVLPAGIAQTVLR